MHAVYLQFLYQLHSVIDEEGCILLLAPFLYLQGYRAHLFIGGTLHAELNPLASASQSLTDTIEITHLLILMRDKLQLKSV